MYEKRYVKKRVRRLAVAIGAGVSSTVVGVFSIVAFLGRFVGTFTVSLDSADVKLALSDSRTFERQESFLHIDTSLPRYNENTFTSLPSFKLVDSEEMDYLGGANYNPDGGIDSISFFKYTFYVKNVGTVTAQYRTTIKIIDSKPTEEENPRYLDDTLRVMLFENYDDTDEHNYTVYAKRRAIAYVGEDKNAIWKEPISIREDQVTPYKPFMGYAEEFESASVIATTSTTNFDVDEVKRYTLVTWLEGNDAQSNPLLPAPEGATLKLGVEINAYEN